jgi:UDP-arabinose 4-epimerase
MSACRASSPGIGITTVFDAVKGTVLVTGGAGYIGSHACKALAAAGWRPVVYDNLAYGHEWAVKWGPLERGDIADPGRLDAVFAATQPVAVMHFAAFAYVGESVADPSKYYANNVAGTLTLLDAARRAGVARVVFSSTCATYGMPQRATLEEAHPQAPINPYGFTKLVIERMLSDYRAAYGLRSIALRYFNAAGADPDGEIGEAHAPETHLVPLALGAALGTRPPITVFGTDYATPDGTCIRDYIHVTDLAAGHVAALERLAGEPPRPAYNLGTGAGYSVRQVLERIGAISGRAVPHRLGPRRAGDPDRLVAAVELARAELGWRPRHSDLDTILRTALAWETRKAA